MFPSDAVLPGLKVLSFMTPFDIVRDRLLIILTERTELNLLKSSLTKKESPIATKGLIAIAHRHKIGAAGSLKNIKYIFETMNKRSWAPLIRSPITKAG